MQQIKCFYELELYEFALKLAKCCIDMCPESFESWYMYAKINIALGDLHNALYAIDSSPLSDEIEYFSLP